MKIPKGNEIFSHPWDLSDVDFQLAVAPGRMFSQQYVGAPAPSFPTVTLENVCDHGFPSWFCEHCEKFTTVYSGQYTRSPQRLDGGQMERIRADVLRLQSDVVDLQKAKPVENFPVVDTRTWEETLEGSFGRDFCWRSGAADAETPPRFFGHCDECKSSPCRNLRRPSNSAAKTIETDMDLRRKIDQARTEMLVAQRELKEANEAHRALQNKAVDLRAELLVAQDANASMKARLLALKLVFEGLKDG